MTTHATHNLNRDHYLSLLNTRTAIANGQELRLVEILEQQSHLSPLINAAKEAAHQIAGTLNSLLRNSADAFRCEQKKAKTLCNRALEIKAAVKTEAERAEIDAIMTLVRKAVDDAKMRRNARVKELQWDRSYSNCSPLIAQMELIKGQTWKDIVLKSNQTPHEYEATHPAEDQESYFSSWFGSSSTASKASPSETNKPSVSTSSPPPAATTPSAPSTASAPTSEPVVSKAAVEKKPSVKPVKTYKDNGAKYAKIEMRFKFESAPNGAIFLESSCFGKKLCKPTADPKKFTVTLEALRLTKERVENVKHQFVLIVNGKEQIVSLRPDAFKVENKVAKAKIELPAFEEAPVDSHNTVKVFIYFPKSRDYMVWVKGVHATDKNHGIPYTKVVFAEGEEEKILKIKRQKEKEIEFANITIANQLKSIVLRDLHFIKEIS